MLNQKRNIRTALGVGVALLIGNACSSDSAGPEADIVGGWTRSSISTTSASGGSNGIYTHTYRFNNSHQYTYTIEFQSTTGSVPNTPPLPVSQIAGTYSLGTETLASDGSSARELDLLPNDNALPGLYFIYQIDSGSSLFLSDPSLSSGSAGSAPDNRAYTLGHTPYLKL